MKLYDSHAHTNMTPLIEKFEEICNEAKSKNIYFNIVGTSNNDSKIAIKQALFFPSNARAIIGIHPSETNNIFDLNEIRELCKQNNKIVVAIGETGLDYHYENCNKKNQQKAFIEQIKIAQDYRLPLIVHTRNAHEDTYNILKKHKIKNQKIIIHCYSGTENDLKKYLELDCFISISGIVTFKNAIDLQKQIKLIPLNKLIIETDSPWLSPEPNRGKTNSPLNIECILNKISEILNIEKEKLANQIFENTIKLFNF